MSKKAVDYSEVFRFLSNKRSKYEEDCPGNRKRAIRFSERIDLEDGLLFYLQLIYTDGEYMTASTPDDSQAALNSRYAKYTEMQW